MVSRSPIQTAPTAPTAPADRGNEVRPAPLQRRAASSWTPERAGQPDHPRRTLRVRQPVPRPIDDTRYVTEWARQ
jgi:hypothetical protein